MFTFCKITDPEYPNIKYGYYLKVKTVIELLNWFNATMPSNARDIVEVIDGKEMWGDGDHPSPFNKFSEILLTYQDRLCLITACKNISQSGVVLHISDSILKSKMDFLLEFGTIYINSKGGFLFGKHIVEKQNFEFKEFVFPEGLDIKVKKWYQGKHWYAYVGDMQVEVSGESKWNTKSEAEKKARYFKKRMRKKTAVFP